MNLLDIRKHVVQLSGRFDLVSELTNYTPVSIGGVDFFITAGQKFLDDRVDTPGTERILSAALAAGEYTVSLPKCRALKEVWVSDDSDEGVTRALVTPTIDIVRKYGAPTFSEADQGMPKYFMIYPLRTDDPAVGNVDNLIKTIYILPPADGAYTVYARGSFYTAPLSGLTDINWWSSKYPHILIQAAIYSLEKFYRNSEGMKDALAAIDLDLQGIDFNMAEEAIGEQTFMNNAW